MIDQLTSLSSPTSIHKNLPIAAPHLSPECLPPLSRRGCSLLALLGSCLEACRGTSFWLGASEPVFFFVGGNLLYLFTAFEKETRRLPGLQSLGEFLPLTALTIRPCRVNRCYRRLPVRQNTHVLLLFLPS